MCQESEKGSCVTVKPLPCSRSPRLQWDCCGGDKAIENYKAEKGDTYMLPIGCMRAAITANNKDFTAKDIGNVTKEFNDKYGKATDSTVDYVKKVTNLKLTKKPEVSRLLLLMRFLC